jgi:hypothetical protein
VVTVKKGCQLEQPNIQTVQSAHSIIFEKNLIQIFLSLARLLVFYGESLLSAHQFVLCFLDGLNFCDAFSVFFSNYFIGFELLLFRGAKQLKKVPFFTTM